MPIQIKAPDGSIAQFPDGTADSVITSAMAKAYPAPSLMQTIAASPMGRFAHDAILQPIGGAASLLAKLDPTGGAVAPATASLEKSYGDAVAAQRNRPGYAQARQQADGMAASRGAGGLTDQVAAPMLPALAGAAGGLFGGSLNASNAAADAQTAAQQNYAKANPTSSSVAQIAGGFMAGPDGAMANLPAGVPKQIAPSIPSLRGAAKQAYQTVDNSGVRVSSDALNRMADNLQDKMAERLDPTLHPEATAAYNRVMKFGTDQPEAVAPASFTQLDNLRRVVADAGQAVKPADRALARQIQDHVDDFVGNLNSSDLDTTALDQARGTLTSATGAKGNAVSQIRSIEVNKPGALAARGAAGKGTRDAYMALHDQIPQLEAQRQAALSDFNAENTQIQNGPQDTIDALNNARDLWSRSAKAQTLQNIIDKAKNNSTGFAQSGYENALRSGFRKLLNNERGISRFNPDEVAAIKQVATGGSPFSATNLLRQVGKLSPQGAIPILSEIGMYGVAGPSALAVPAAGIAGRAGATVLQGAAARNAVNLAALGRTAIRPATVSALKLPTAIPSKLPYGLFGSGMMQPQNQ